MNLAHVYRPGGVVTFCYTSKEKVQPTDEDSKPCRECFFLSDAIRVYGGGKVFKRRHPEAT